MIPKIVNRGLFKHKLMCRTMMPFSTTSATKSQDIILEEKGGVGWITLNRPKALNALNLEMIREMHPQLSKWQDDPAIKTVVVKGSGEKAFCAGGDIMALTGENGSQIQKEFFSEEYKLDNLVGNFRKPYVAILNGIVMGGGVGISVHAQYRVATQNTVFAMPETGIGLVPDVGGAYFLPRLEGSLGMFLGLTGHRLKGRDCLHAGIATHAVHSQNIPDLESAISSNPQNIKTILDEFHHKSSFEVDKGSSLEPHMETINRIFSKPTVEEILQLLKEEKSEFSGKVLKNLGKASPSSLKVGHRQLTQGRHIENLSKCLEMEYRLVMGCCANPDFYEGVRALLVDRDNSPKWSPATLEDVTEEHVDSYFKPLPADQELNL